MGIGSKGHLPSLDSKLCNILDFEMWTKSQNLTIQLLPLSILSHISPFSLLTFFIFWSIVLLRLNYLNWKEKGGQEWTKQDEIQLITR